MAHAVRSLLLVLVAAVATAVAGCGSSGSGGVVRPPSSGASEPAASSTPSTPTSSSSSVSTAHPAATVVPAHGLHDRQSVAVRGTGFTPGEALQIIECAALGAKTGPGDCNLTGMLSVTADSYGTVTAKLTVLRGPFGADRVTCSSRQPCLVSVTQASLSPTEEADATISFAP